MKPSIPRLATVLCLILPTATRAAEFKAENERLTVTYDDAFHGFSLTEKATGNTFLTNGKLEGLDLKVAEEPATDPVFGTGRKIVVTQAEGRTASLELYQGLPFLLARKEIVNNPNKRGQIDDILLSPQEREQRKVDRNWEIERIVPATFSLDLGTSPYKLRTMGTAGLSRADQHPGSYLFLTLADPATRRGVVAGWLTQDRGSGVLFSDIPTLGNKVDFKARIDYGHLRIPEGKSARLETLAIGIFDDARIGQELYADAIKKQYHIKLNPQVTGYCTWYSEVGGLTDPKNGAGALNEKDIKTLAEFAAKELKPFGFDFVQIDDEWQDGATNPDGTRINGPRRGFTRHKPNGPYPSGMAPNADRIKANGLTAGLWFLPFARNHQDPEYQDRKDWFMYRQDGMPYETTWGGTSLDITNPKVQAHLAELAKTVKGWGYNYFKMDGLWTGSCTEQVYVNDGYKEDHIGYHKPFHDPNVTNIEALRLGLKTLRKAAGPEVFFSGCCASQSMRSIAGSIGLVDSMRIGPDNGFGWQDYRNETMHFEGGGIITGPIRANRLYFLHGRVWWNDPDPAYVRPAVKLEHARLLASWVAVSGNFNLNSDWLPELPKERLDILKRCMPSHHCQARPVDYFDSVMPSIWLLTDSTQSVRRDVLGLYNWDSTPATIGYNAAKAGLDGAKTYHAFDFWSNSTLPDFKGEFKFDLLPEACRVVAVRAAEDHPVLLSTSRHVTQGIVDVTNEVWDDPSATLTAQSAIVANDPYELRIAGLADGKSWKPLTVQLSTADQAAGVIAAMKTDGTLLRITINSPVCRTVKWSVKFSQ